MRERTKWFQLAGATLIALVLAVAAAGGGDDDDDGGGEAAEPKPLAIEATGSGRDVKLTVPKSVEAGPVSIRFTNSGRGARDAQLGRVDEGHTVEEALQAGGAWAEEGKPLPPWVHLAGGVGSTRAGDTATVTQVLEPGQYFVVDVDSNAFAPFEVTGEGGGELEAPAARIDAVEYSFNSSGLQGGDQEILFDNKGREPHVLDALRIKPGKTLDDVRTFLEEEEGEEPIVEEDSYSTAILDGGVRQVVQFDLKPGRYALLCFVPDRKGGPPHVEKGMLSEAEVR
jgi:hypothetical protein